MKKISVVFKINLKVEVASLLEISGVAWEFEGRELEGLEAGRGRGSGVMAHTWPAHRHKHSSESPILKGDSHTVAD